MSYHSDKSLRSAPEGRPSGWHGRQASAPGGGGGEPTLYRYFSDKRALYLGVLQRCRDHVLTEWSRAGDGHSNPLQALDAMGAWYFENARRDPDPLRVRVRAQADSQEDDTQELLRDGYQHIAQFVRDLLAAAKEQGLIDAA